MPLATVLALTSAVLHTAWNMIVEEGRDRWLVEWGVTLASNPPSVSQLLVEKAQRVAHLGRRPDGAERVVLMHVE